jgi:tetratricopeptide (TPR) repeat protein
MKSNFFPAYVSLICIFFLALTIIPACKPEQNKKQKGIDDPILTELNSAIKKNPQSADLYFKRAQFYYGYQGYDEVIADLSKAIKLDSLRPPYYHLLADTYLNYYQSRNALLTMQKASGMFPDSIPTLLKLAELQITLKTYDAAMQTLESVVTKQKGNARARILMGMCLEESKDPARALLAYKKATELDPYLIDGWLKAGILSDEMKLPDAESYFKTALRIDSASYEANYALAMHYQNHKEDDKALKQYEKTSAMFPKLAEPYYNQGAIYLTRDSLDKALSFFKLATEVDKIYAEAYYAMGVIKEMQDKKHEAYVLYSQAAAIKPKYKLAVDAASRLKPAK